MRDKLFDKELDIADFRFDDDVVKVFDDMVRRSVPGYDSMTVSYTHLTLPTN